MNKVTTEVRHVDLNGRNIVAVFELINANDDQFEIELDNPFAEGSVFNDNLAIMVVIDVIGYDRRNPDREIVIQRDVETMISIDNVESSTITFDVVHRGALESEPFETMSEVETMMCLGEDAKVVVRLEVK